MKRLILFFVSLVLLSSFVFAGPVNQVYSFGNYEGQLKNRELVTTLKLVNPDCSYDIDGSYSCNDDFVFRVIVNPALDNYLPTSNDGYDHLPVIEGCNDYGNNIVSCGFPYSFYTWVSSDDFSNVDFINSRIENDFIVSNNGVGVYSSGDDLVFSDYYSDKYFSGVDPWFLYGSDITRMYAIDNGFRSGSFGRDVCNSVVSNSFNSLSSYYSNTDLVDVSACSYTPDDFYWVDGPVVYSDYFYDFDVNYWMYPFNIFSIDYTCSVGSSVVKSGFVRSSNFVNNIPLTKYFEVNDDSVFYDEPVLLGGVSPYLNYNSYDGLISCPTETDSVDVVVDFIINGDYRHISPLDFTASWSDIFSGLSGSRADHQKVTMSWSSLNQSLIIGDLSPQVGVNGSSSTSVDSVVSDSVGGLVSSDELVSSGDDNLFSNDVSDLVDVAKSQALVDSEDSFFSNLLGIAVFVFSLFLIVYNLFVMVVVFSFFFLFMIGLFRGIWGVIDSVFDSLEGGFK